MAGSRTLHSPEFAIYFCYIQVWGGIMSTSSVFTNNRSQAVRLPADCRLPDDVKKVDVRINGPERIISPVGQRWDSFFLNGPTVSDDFMEQRAAQTEVVREDL
jgi:antitoxin VapB